MKKVMVITGGSDGLGKSIAEKLAQNEENEVVILSNQQDKLTDAAIETNSDYQVCDVTNHVSVETAINNILQKYKKIDVLINNAGVWLAGDLAVLPSMYENKKGLIINVCSQASFDSDDFSTVYNASKWAMRGFNRSIQKDLSKKGIKVTGFYPGFMQTNIFKKAGNDYDTSTGLETEKVAKAIEFIISCDDDVIIPEFGIKDIENY